MTPQEIAFWSGFYGRRYLLDQTLDVERTLDEIDTLLAGVDEATAGKVMQAAYRLAAKN
jgi:hypothetical protein